MKVLIFPNDSLIAYLEKGELKDRYFNPNNIFSEVHFITFSSKECKVEEIQKVLGEAKGYIHRLDALSTLDMFMPQRRIDEVQKLAKEIECDIVRGFSTTYSGYFTVEVAKAKGLKSIISLHTNFDDMRYQFIKRKDYLRYLKYFITKYSLEKKVLQEVDQLIAKYKFTKKYAIDNGASENKIELIYNQVFFDKFFPLKKEKKDEIRVISVGNLEIGKGQRVLVDAIPKLTGNILFTFVGNGEDYELLQSKVKEYGVEDRVTFIKSIPNDKLARLYREHDIFSLPIQYGGICIPALEATASGLALVMPKPIHEDTPEITGEYAEVVENSVDGFSRGIQKVADNFELRISMIKKGLKIIQNYNGNIMEQKEANLYKRLIHV